MNGMPSAAMPLTVGRMISRIALAATEQSQGLTKVNDGVSQLDLVTQTNVAMVEETTAECASLSSVAQDLSQLVSHFQIDQSAAGGSDRHDATCLGDITG